MSINSHELIQAVLIANTFGNDFLPLSDDIPLALMPVVNRPLIDYTLEFLALGGVQEVFLFCTSHVDAIKWYIKECQADGNKIWCQMLKIKFVVSDSCMSVGDCLRDLDAKGWIRGNFVLCEPGVIGNINLLPIIQDHLDTCLDDKGAAMTLIYQEIGGNQVGRCPKEDIIIATNEDDRVLYHKRLISRRDKKVDVPLEIFLENDVVNINHNYRDTHVAICSPSVLPLFTDNFDFQSKDDFIKCLMQNEEILASSIYLSTVDDECGAAVTNWRMYHAICREIVDYSFYPTVPNDPHSYHTELVMGNNCKISYTCKLHRVVIGDNCQIGENVQINNARIMRNVIIRDNCVINHTIIGPNCVLNEGCTITIGSVIGKDVELPAGSLIVNTLVQAAVPEKSGSNTKIGEKAYRAVLLDDEGDPDIVGTKLAKRFFGLHLNDPSDSGEDEQTTDSDDEATPSNSPIPDDVNMFFTEVMDSLTRGFEDKLQCENLILEVNSSRYAYNVSLKEVNFNVVKAILSLPFQVAAGQPYLPSLHQLLVYFTPILKNYIRNPESMEDCLEALEEVALTHNELVECIAKILNWLYNKDFVSEESIIAWEKQLVAESGLQEKVKPFMDWLREAEEATSSEEESD